jgi:hypothetical protein
MRVVRREELWRLPRLVWLAIAHSIVVIVIIRIAWVLPGIPQGTGWRPFTWPDLARIGLVFAIVVIPPTLWIFHRLRFGAMIGYSIIFTVVLSLLNEIEALTVTEFCKRTGAPPPIVRYEGLTTMVPMWRYVFAYTLGGTLILAAVTAAYLRARYGRWMMQDGTRCRQCGYSVVGTCNRICPECGREFTYQELGTTEAEFRERQNSLGMLEQTGPKGGADGR